jgi:C4-dicarboxylate transporter DctM subunit
MNEVMIGLIALCVLLFLFATGIELGFAMSAVGIAGFAFLNSPYAAWNLLGRDIFDALSSYGFTVVPLFILMGQIGSTAGIALRMYNSAHKFVGHIPGGLAMSTVLGATGFKAICGSSPATAATFATVAIPEMNRYGYDVRLSTGIVASVSTLGAIIPPSIALILFGVITEQSIGKLFLAGLIPGLMASAFFIAIIYIWAKINPNLAPSSEPFSWKERIRSLPEVIWVVIVFLLVVGGIMMGIFTPTEAGAVGTFALLLLALIRKDMTFKKYMAALHESCETAVMIMMLITGSLILGHFITATNIPQHAADWIVGLPFNRWAIMILICLIYEIGGSFIDDLAFMVLATPIFFPAVLKLGFDPIWFGMVVAITVMIGIVIPPVAICVFVVHNITKVPIGVIYKGVAPFLLSLVVVGILLFLFPGIALWLPSLLMK